MIFITRLLFLKIWPILLSSKIRDHDEYDALRIIHREREILMDTIEKRHRFGGRAGLCHLLQPQLSKIFSFKARFDGKPDSGAGAAQAGSGIVGYAAGDQ